MEFELGMRSRLPPRRIARLINEAAARERGRRRRLRWLCGLAIHHKQHEGDHSKLVYNACRMLQQVRKNIARIA